MLHRIFVLCALLAAGNLARPGEGLLVAGGARPAMASPALRTIRVHQATGTDAPDCGTAAKPCKTIQQGVNLAADGDVILVGGGTYNAASSCLSGSAVVCILNKRLYLYGGYTPADGWSTYDPISNLTVIDGQNARRGVRIQKTGIGQPAASLTMKGFTIQNGRAQGAASGNDDQIFAFGGGLLSEFAWLRLSDLIFNNNQAIGGGASNTYGGVGAGGGMAINASAVDYGYDAALDNIRFKNNRATGGNGSQRGGYGQGGGLFTFYMAVSGSNVTFVNNTAAAGSSNGSGGVNGAFADGQGGAACIQTASNVSLQQVVAAGNSALGGDAPNGNAGGAFGGAFFVEYASLTLADLTANNNSALAGDGQNNINYSSTAQGGGVGALYASLHLNRAKIIANTATGGSGSVYRGTAGGGGLAVVLSTVAYITNTLIADNLAQMGAAGANVGGGGGGLFLQGSNVVLNHATIARNNLGNAVWMQGQGMLLLSLSGTGANVNVNYGIIANHANGSGAAALHVQPGNTVNLNRGQWAANSKNTNSDGSPGPSGSFNGLGSMLSAASAGFVSPGSPNYNYRLLSDSAARDQAAGSAAALDADGRPRFDTPDIGAFEYIDRSVFAPVVRQP